MRINKSVSLPRLNPNMHEKINKYRIGTYIENKLTGEEAVITDIKSNYVVAYDYINMRQFNILKSKLLIRFDITKN